MAFTDSNPHCTNSKLIYKVEELVCTDNKLVVTDSELYCTGNELICKVHIPPLVCSTLCLHLFVPDNFSRGYFGNEVRWPDHHQQ